MMKVMIWTLALLLGGVGCKSEIDGKVGAQVADPPSVAQPAPAEAPPLTVPFDLSRSKIEWTAARITKDHKGGFKTLTGNVSYHEDRTIRAVDVEIDTTSVYADVEKLTNHLKTADFFEVDKFPTATFKTSSIENTEGDAYIVTGLLDLHGVTKKISFPATIRTDGPNLIATAEFTLLRFDFGIAYKGAPDDLIKPEVLIRLTVVAPKPSDR